MKEALFSETFRFRRFSYDRYHYTDNLKGSPHHYFAYLEQGRCKIVSERGIREFAAGDIFYIPLGLKYQSYWYGEPTVSFRSYGFLFFPDGEQKHFCLQKIPCDGDVAGEICSLPVDSTVDCALLGRFYTAVAKVLPSMQVGSFDRAKTVYRDAMAFLTDRPDATVPQMAEACHVSESMLYAVFHKIAGKSPNTVRQELLTDRAVLLLITTDRQVQEISDSLGFSSVSYFRKILKKHTGKTPSEIRNSAEGL